MIIIRLWNKETHTHTHILLSSEAEREWDKERVFKHTHVINSARGLFAFDLSFFRKMLSHSVHKNGQNQCYCLTLKSVKYILTPHTHTYTPPIHTVCCLSSAYSTRWPNTISQCLFSSLPASCVRVRVRACVCNLSLLCTSLMHSLHRPIIRGPLWTIMGFMSKLCNYNAERFRRFVIKWVGLELWARNRPQPPIHHVSTKKQK